MNATPGEIQLGKASSAFGKLTTLLCALIGLASVSSAPAHAADVPEGFTDRQIYSGFTSPSVLHTLPDGRVLVVQQNGVVRLIKNDSLQSANFYTVQNVDDFWETGCLGITSDPGFMSNGYVYLYCTIQNGSQSHNRILRITAQGDTAPASSEQVILDLPVIPPDADTGAKIYTHLGGAMRFGADGKLYIATGGHENSRISPPSASFSQQLGSPFGKILRINPDGSFPSDNPYFNTAGAYRGVYALGLRNPFGMDVQPGTDLLLINDVGAGSYEEILRGEAGANYGWPAFDGNASDPQYTDGLYVYEHGVDASGKLRCAVTGGAFYNPLTSQFPGVFEGKYLFTDYCSGAIYRIDPSNPTSDTEFASGISGPVSLAVSADGSLYYLARNTVGEDGIGMLGKIEYSGSQVPRIGQHPQNQMVQVGEPVTFSINVSGATSLQWQRNGADIPGANSASYTIDAAAASDDGATYRVVAQNGFGTITSNPATLSITSGGLPQVSITSPTEGSGYAGGDTLNYAATATDPEDGAMPDSAFTWQGNFHHDTHVHPFFPATNGSASGSVTVPGFETTVANTWMRLILNVEDTAGQVRTVTRDLFPRYQLSELNPSRAPENGNGPIERDMHNGGAEPGDGGTISLDNIPYPKGLGVHAPSDIRYALGDSCTGNFIADVGLDDSVGSGGSAVFQVFLDDELAFDSGRMTGSDERQAVNVSVNGKRELRLVVTDGGDGNVADRANWGGARVTCSSLPQGTVGPSEGFGGAGGVGAVPGGGCTTGGSGRFDPTLIGLIFAALGMLLWRRVGRRKSRQA